MQSQIALADHAVRLTAHSLFGVSSAGRTERRPVGLSSRFASGAAGIFWTTQIQDAEAIGRPAGETRWQPYGQRQAIDLNSAPVESPDPLSDLSLGCPSIS
jgi:hypothetical protein